MPVFHYRFSYNLQSKNIFACTGFCAHENKLTNHIVAVVNSYRQCPCGSRRSRFLSISRRVGWISSSAHGKRMDGHRRASKERFKNRTQPVDKTLFSPEEGEKIPTLSG